MITLIEYIDGYEPIWDVVNDRGEYLGFVNLDTFDGYVRGLGDAGTEFEIVRD